MLKLSRRKFLLIGGVTVTTIVSYSFVEPYFFEVNKISIPLGLNLQALHITDLHIKDWRFKNEILNVISDLSSKVDVTFITGDIYDKYTQTLEAVRNYLSRINCLLISLVNLAETEYNLLFVAHNKLSKMKPFSNINLFTSLP